jgi:hypothetical protein
MNIERRKACAGISVLELHSVRRPILVNSIDRRHCNDVSVKPILLPSMKRYLGLENALEWC